MKKIFKSLIVVNLLLFYYLSISFALQVNFKEFYSGTSYENLLERQEQLAQYRIELAKYNACLEFQRTFRSRKLTSEEVKEYMEYLFCVAPVDREGRLGPTASFQSCSEYLYNNSYKQCREYISEDVKETILSIDGASKINVFISRTDNYFGNHAPMEILNSKGEKVFQESQKSTKEIFTVTGNSIKIREFMYSSVNSKIDIADVNEKVAISFEDKSIHHGLFRDGLLKDGEIINSDGTKELIYRFTFNLKKGWNLISIPVRLQNKTLGDIFPDFIDAYSYQTNYIVINKDDYINFGAGIFISIPEDKSYTVVGEPINSYQSTMNQGWSMIGSVSRDSVIPKTEPENAIKIIWGFINGSYVSASSIEEGSGYFININQDCELIIDTNQ